MYISTEYILHTEKDQFLLYNNNTAVYYSSCHYEKCVCFKQYHTILCLFYMNILQCTVVHVVHGYKRETGCICTTSQCSLCTQVKVMNKWLEKFRCREKDSGFCPFESIHGMSTLSNSLDHLTFAGQTIPIYSRLQSETWCHIMVRMDRLQGGRV